MSVMRILRLRSLAVLWMLCLWDQLTNVVVMLSVLALSGSGYRIPLCDTAMVLLKSISDLLRLALLHSGRLGVVRSRFFRLDGGFGSTFGSQMQSAT